MKSNIIKRRGRINPTKQIKSVDDTSSFQDDASWLVDLQNKGLRTSGLIEGGRRGGAGPSDDRAFMLGDQAVMLPTLNGPAEHSLYSLVCTLEDLAEYFRQSAVVSSEKPGIFQFQTSNNVILSDSVPVALIDVEDLIIVASKNGILISKRGSSHKVKHVFNQNNLSQR
ncbi:hypothetical protein QFZ77_003139 [Paenibacillus sp. V4I3]|uniref:hypothetical protein n=1 Tax=unclassified Paenibacillus TaxID=185978 RepID=UPI002783EC7C|nr:MULTISPECIES: hypothetical protein [unclassified Paenibacillus]MDQ0874480.1 hypothetical protein [Paenibacillus sp. V4I3]MDQ0889762.1 hypothetical protein [Paenibacillus sp. V4I9]